jgi:hypothetical protein
MTETRRRAYIRFSKGAPNGAPFSTSSLGTMGGRIVNTAGDSVLAEFGSAAAQPLIGPS